MEYLLSLQGINKEFGFSCSALGRGAKVDHVLGQKAGSLDQRANLSPSPIGAPVRILEADLRMGMRNLEADLVLVPPKKMEKVM